MRERARQVRAATGDAPDLPLLELGNAVWKRHRRGEVSVDVITAALHLASDYVRLHPSGQVAVPAVELAVALGCPAYDCPFLAPAQLAGVPLMTADEKFHAKLGGFPGVRLPTA